MFQAIQRASRKPDFFILGAAKCGTTSLHHYLNRHPDIYMSPIKEPCFFCDTFQVVRTEQAYLRLFEHATPGQHIGESSHVYLTSPGTPTVLHRLFPHARFLLIFRHPADRAYALYLHMRRMGLETARSFEEALELEKTRMNDAHFRTHCPHYFYNFCYFHSGLYGEQVARYLALFPRDRFHVMTQHALREHPDETLAAVFRFLGVDDGIRLAPEQRNPGVAPRFPRLQAALARTGLVRFSERHPRLAEMGSRLARTLLYRKQVPPMHPDTRRRLVARYREDQARFRQLTGLDLGE